MRSDRCFRLTAAGLSTAVLAATLAGAVKDTSETGRGRLKVGNLGLMLIIR